MHITITLDVQEHSVSLDDCPHLTADRASPEEIIEDRISLLAELLDIDHEQAESLYWEHRSGSMAD